MQYKIPVHIENDDPIIWPFSLKQLWICMIGCWIGYGLFKSLEPRVWFEIAAIPSWLIIAFTFVVVLFKKAEMTFLMYILALLRFNINFKERCWKWWVDSFSPLDIWIITLNDEKKDKDIKVKDKSADLETFENHLNKI